MGFTASAWISPGGGTIPEDPEDPGSGGGGSDYDTYPQSVSGMNGWSGTGTAPWTYQKDFSNTVRYNGTVTKGTFSTVGTYIGQVPSNRAPLSSVTRAVNVTTGFGSMSVTIGTDGAIHIASISGTVNAISFSGISYTR